MSVYKCIGGYPEYHVSRCGSVVSGAKLRPLKPRVVNGYHHVTIGGRSGWQVAIHVLVAEAFISARPSGMVVNHINADRQDNRVENLEWVTQSQNVMHAYALGLRVIGQAQRDQCAAMGRARRKQQGVSA